MQVHSGIKKSKRSSKATFLCAECGINFTRKDNYSRHIREKHSSNDSISNSQITDDIQEADSESSSSREPAKTFAELMQRQRIHSAEDENESFDESDDSMETDNDEMSLSEDSEGIITSEVADVSDRASHQNDDVELSEIQKRSWIGALVEAKRKLKIDFYCDPELEMTKFASFLEALDEVVERNISNMRLLLAEDSIYSRVKSTRQKLRNEGISKVQVKFKAWEKCGRLIKTIMKKHRLAIEGNAESDNESESDISSYESEPVATDQEQLWIRLIKDAMQDMKTPQHFVKDVLKTKQFPHFLELLAKKTREILQNASALYASKIYQTVKDTAELLLLDGYKCSEAKVKAWWKRRFLVRQLIIKYKSEISDLMESDTDCDEGDSENGDNASLSTEENSVSEEENSKRQPTRDLDRSIDMVTQYYSGGKRCIPLF